MPAKTKEQVQAMADRAGLNLQGYAYPFRKAKGVQPERIDMGVDFSGKPGSKITAIAPGTITEADYAWIGAQGAPSPGTFINEHITSGSAKGQNWYTAEDIIPKVKVGQRVNANTVIGTFTGNVSNPNRGQSESGWAVGPSAPGQTKAAQYGQQATGTDPGAKPTAFGASAEQLLVALGAPKAPNAGQAVSGKLPDHWFPSKKLPKQSNQPINAKTTASIFSIPGDISHFFDLLSSADLWERIGLVLLGGILILIGLAILAAPVANQAVREAAGLTRAGRTLGVIGSSGSSGPTPEQQADRQRRVELAERNTAIGERKVSVLEQKESRLQLGRKERPTKHRSGIREPNPAPAHS